MRKPSRRVSKFGALSIVAASSLLFGFHCPGLNFFAMLDLHFAGVDRYVGDFQPASSVPLGEDWTMHTFDPEDGDGPICIAGTPLTVFTQERSSNKVLVVLDGGGACWQDFYFCEPFADSDLPTGGIFDDEFDDGSGPIQNPFANWSKVFISYCDGSVFSGDHTVTDDPNPASPFGPVRHHRGLRNLTAGLDLAKDLFPRARKLLLSGISAGGFGVAGFAPSVSRFVFPFTRLRVFNDSGPAIANVDLPDEAMARANDWEFDQFYPSSCTDCDVFGQPAEFLEWTLDNDRGYRGALYSTDADATIRFFLSIPTQEEYRDLLLDVHDPINAEHPRRYKRFIRSGSDTHTALASDGFYTFEADGVPLYEWTEDFAKGRQSWVDIVEDLVPVP